MVVGAESRDVPASILKPSDALAVGQLDIDAELPELLVEELHELGSVDSLGEAGVVLDLGSVGGKSSDQGLLHEQCLEPCASSVEGGRHSTSATADDDDIIIFDSLFHGFVSPIKNLPPWQMSEPRGQVIRRGLVELRSLLVLPPPGQDPEAEKGQELDQQGRDETAEELGQVDLGTGSEPGTGGSLGDGTGDCVSNTEEGEADPQLDIAFTHPDEGAGSTSASEDGSDSEDEGTDAHLKVDDVARHVVGAQTTEVGTELGCMLAEEEDCGQGESDDDSPGELGLTGEAGVAVGRCEAEAGALHDVAESESDDHEERSLGVGRSDDEGDDEEGDDQDACDDDLDPLVPELLLSCKPLPVGPLVGHGRHEELQQLSADCRAEEDEEEEEPGSQRELGQLGEESTDVAAASHLGTDTHQETADDGSEGLLVVLDVPDLPLGRQKAGDACAEQESDIGDGSAPETPQVLPTMQRAIAKMTMRTAPV